jgi:hypothetical protein
MGAGLMMHRSARIVGYHLLVRLRELPTDRKRMWYVCTTALAFVMLFYTVADQLFSAGLGDALDRIAVRIVLHSVLALCIPIAVFLSIDALKTNGVWTRLSFYPIGRSVLVFVVLGEAFLITTVAALGLLTPVAIAAARNGQLEFYSYVVSVVVILFFVGAMVSWSLYLGLLIVRFVDEKWAKYALEVVALSVIVVNGLMLAKTGSTTQTLHPILDRAAPYLPTTPAVTIVESSIAGLQIPLATCVVLLFQVVVPLTLLRWIPVDPKTATQADIKEVRKAKHPRLRSFDKPAFRDRSLAATMAVCLQKELFREPGHLRYLAFVTIAMILMAVFVGTDKNPSQGVGDLISIVAVGLLAFAILVSSLSLPLEKSNIVRLRMSSIRPTRLLVGKLAASAHLPLLLFIVAAAVVSAVLPLGLSGLSVLFVVGAAVILVGSAIGLVMGASVGSYSWTEPSRIYNPVTRLFLTIPVVTGLFFGHKLIDRLLSDLYGGALGSFAIDSLVVLLASAFVVVVALAIAVPAFRRRDLDV